MSKGAAEPASAEQQLAGFIDKFSPEHQRLIRAARKILQRRLPGAHELVYDNYNFFVIGYGPGPRPSQAWLSLAAAANGVSLCFLHGARLPDPARRLHGSGNQVRSLRLESAQVLQDPAVDALIDAAIEYQPAKLPPNARSTLVIRSVSARQRPRRKDLAR
jgi:hypothetical protein